MLCYSSAVDDPYYGAAAGGHNRLQVNFDSICKKNNNHNVIVDAAGSSSASASHPVIVKEPVQQPTTADFQLRSSPGSQQQQQRPRCPQPRNLFSLQSQESENEEEDGLSRSIRYDGDGAAVSSSSTFYSAQSPASRMSKLSAIVRNRVRKSFKKKKNRWRGAQEEEVDPHGKPFSTYYCDDEGGVIEYRLTEEGEGYEATFVRHIVKKSNITLTERRKCKEEKGGGATSSPTCTAIEIQIDDVHNNNNEYPETSDDTLHLILSGLQKVSSEPHNSPMMDKEKMVELVEHNEEEEEEEEDAANTSSNSSNIICDDEEYEGKTSSPNHSMTTDRWPSAASTPVASNVSVVYPDEQSVPEIGSSFSAYYLDSKLAAETDDKKNEKRAINNVSLCGNRVIARVEGDVSLFDDSFADDAMLLSTSKLSASIMSEDSMSKEEGELINRSHCTKTKAPKQKKDVTSSKRSKIVIEDIVCPLETEVEVFMNGPYQERYLDEYLEKLRALKPRKPVPSYIMQMMAEEFKDIGADCRSIASNAVTSTLNMCR